MVAEPGELADKFLQSVKSSLLLMMKGRRRTYASAITNISTVADLVSCRPYFQIGGVVHRYIGRQTQVCCDLYNLVTLFYGQFNVGYVLIYCLLSLRSWKMIEKLVLICFAELFLQCT